MCFTCWEWAGVDEVDTPEANMTVLSSVQDAALNSAFLVGIHLLLEKIVLILLINFEDNTVTFIGGLCVFSLPTFFFCGHFSPAFLQTNA